MAVLLAVAATAGLASSAVPRTTGGAQMAGLEPVVVAARDLPAGARLHEGDVAVARLPGDRVPDGATRLVSAARGHTLAGPVRRGEPLTDRRFLGPPLLDGYGPGRDRHVAAPVRIADAASARLLRPGDRIDVLAGPGDRSGEHGGAGGGGPDGGTAGGTGAGSTGDAEVVASGVRVVAVPAPAGDGATRAEGGEGALVVLAVPRRVAAALAGAAATSGRLSITLR